MLKAFLLLATMVESGITSFKVNITNAASFPEAVLEVSERIKLFCYDSIKGGECEILNEKAQVKIIKRRSDGVFTNGITHLIGSEIEFLIEFLLNQVRDEESVGQVLVGITIFCHVKDSLKDINRIKNSIEGEINRTNRKWRRKLNAGK